MTGSQILDFALSYACYFLGAVIFTIDLIAKYKLMAESNPDKDVVFDSKAFWKKENINVIKVLLLGVASMILLVPLNGISMDFVNSAGDLMFTVSAKTAMLPIYLILGWSGGRGTIALAGQYKKSFYARVGITGGETIDNGK